MSGIKANEQQGDRRTGKQPNSIGNDDEWHVLVMIFLNLEQWCFLEDPRCGGICLFFWGGGVNHGPDGLICHPFKKNAYARGLAGGGWALLELTGALRLEL